MSSAAALAQASSGSTCTQNSDLLSISLVVPCFNESESIDQLRERIMHLVEKSAQQIPEAAWQFVFVDDGSQDDTYDRLQQAFGQWPAAQIVRHAANRGLIAALVTGFSAANSPWVAVIDSDCTYDPLILIDMFQRLQKDKLDVITASPYHPQGAVENVPAWRIALSQTASRLYRLVMRSRLTCYTSCVRIYRTDLVKNCSIASSGFVGVTELLWRVDQMGSKIGEWPATLRPRTTGISKMRTLRTMRQHFQLLGRILLSKLGFRQ